MKFTSMPSGSRLDKVKTENGKLDEDEDDNDNDNEDNIAHR